MTHPNVYILIDNLFGKSLDVFKTLNTECPNSLFVIVKLSHHKYQQYIAFHSRFQIGMLISLISIFIFIFFTFVTESGPPESMIPFGLIFLNDPNEMVCDLTILYAPLLNSCTKISCKNVL